MKCEICKKQTSNIIEDGEDKRCICEECLEDTLVDTTEDQLTEEVKCAFTIRIHTNDEISISVDGYDINSINLRGLISAAQIIIEDKLKKEVLGDD